MDNNLMRLFKTSFKQKRVLPLQSSLLGNNKLIPGIPYCFWNCHSETTTYSLGFISISITPLMAYVPFETQKSC